MPLGELNTASLPPALQQVTGSGALYKETRILKPWTTHQCREMSTPRQAQGKRDQSRERQIHLHLNLVIPAVESEGEGQGQGPFSVFLSWESETMMMPQNEKGGRVKGDPGSLEGESKGLTPLQRFQCAPLRGERRTLHTGPQHALSSLSGTDPVPSLVLALFLYIWPNVKLDTLAFRSPRGPSLMSHLIHLIHESFLN